MRTPCFHIAILTAFLANTFGPVPVAQAQEYRLLPAPGVMVHLSPEFNPPILRGIKVHPDNPFRFDFILDKGDSPSVIPAKGRHARHSQLFAGIHNQEQLKSEATKLIKYFLASLTIPEKDLWVNLSPYEKDRIIPNSFGLTEMGRDLLVEDYMLKQITASLIYPEDEIGKKFWKRIYEEAQKKFGTTNIPVNTFNKVWIVPEKAVVYENAKAGTAYVVEAKLKVMLEQDYLALQKQPPLTPSLTKEGVRGSSEGINALGSQIVREIVIPELTKEVNENKNFAKLRQVYNSLILATWYKKKIKDSVLAQVYADKNKVAGVGYEKSLSSPNANQTLSSPNALIGDPEYIYQRYLQAFKKGVFNYIKEEQDPLTQQVIPRKYFSGGIQWQMDKAMVITSIIEKGKKLIGNMIVSIRLSYASRNFIKKAAKIVIIGAVSGMFVLTSFKAIDSVDLKTKKKESTILYKLDEIKNLDDRKTMDVIESIINQALQDNKAFEDIYPLLRKHAEENGNLKQAFKIINERMKKMMNGHRDIRYTLNLSGEQDIILKHFIAQITKYAYFYWINMVGMRDEVLRREAWTYLSKNTYLKYYGTPETIAETWNSYLPLNGEHPIFINIAEIPNLGTLADALSHELIHFLTHIPKRSGNAGIDQLVKLSEIGGHDDVTWLLASAYGKIFSSKIRREGKQPKRQDSPLETHAMIREIHSDTWERQKNDIEKSYASRIGDIEPKVTYFQGRALAEYAVFYYEPVPEFLVKLYGTHHKDMHFAQMELATAVLRNIIQAKNQGKYTLRVSMPQFENIIIDQVKLRRDVRENISYTQLKAIEKEITSSLLDRAMTIVEPKSGFNSISSEQKGGIDLTPANMNLQTQNGGKAIKFHLDPAQLQQLQNAPGFVPVIINIQPMTNFRIFLGLDTDNQSAIQQGDVS